MVTEVTVRAVSSLRQGPGTGAVGIHEDGAGAAGVRSHGDGRARYRHELPNLVGDSPVPPVGSVSSACSVQVPAVSEKT